MSTQIEQLTMANTAQRPPLVLGGMDFEEVTEIISKPIEQKAPTWWLISFVSSLSGLLLLKAMLALLVWEGVGVWGLNNPVGWGFAIVNFVFWVGIAHAGT